MNRPTVNFTLYSGKTEPCYVDIANYMANPNSIALQLTCLDGEPMAMTTVNLGYGLDFGLAFLDTNNVPLEKLKDFLEKTGAEPVKNHNGKEVTARSGYCEYPLYKFDLDKLKEFDPKGFDRVSSAIKGYEKEQDEIDEQEM